MRQNHISTYATIESSPEAQSTKAARRIWTTADSIVFERAYKIHGNKWKEIEKEMGNRSKNSIRKYAERIGKIKEKGVRKKRDGCALSCVVNSPGTYLTEGNLKAKSTHVDEGLEHIIEEKKSEENIEFKGMDTLLLAGSHSTSNSSKAISTIQDFNGYRFSIFSEDDPLY
eukprot:TRINITY_DN11183_c0_g1_i1.p1 TRINITY_DN11183_c0_g1~~TRINITY_DN11183_c0_g1_i1.p1  ORF type:complete len:171 (+),score=14.69 TRINITY_DN11183_c0_g1_i1:205-717(+)